MYPVTFTAFCCIFIALLFNLCLKRQKVNVDGSHKTLFFYKKSCVKLAKQQRLNGVLNFFIAV